MDFYADVLRLDENRPAELYVRQRDTHFDNKYIDGNITDINQCSRNRSMPRLLLSLFVALILNLALPGAQAADIPYLELPLAELKRIATQGDPLAQFYLGVRYDLTKKDHKQAATWYRKAAEQGDAGAQVLLGVMYANGRGVPQDYKQAVAWYRKAAEQGNDDAQKNLGSLYAGGRGVPQDDKQAAAWFRKAAAQGHADAQTLLGIMYTLGQGVPQDYKQAVAWYRKAAEQGGDVAQKRLGVMYDNGWGVPRDPVLAYMLYNLAATGGDDKASGKRAALINNLSPQQIEEGQALTAKWKVGTPLPLTSKTGDKAAK
jgi:TPR repeat protein